MKLLVCGKGGSGKTIITALLAKEFAERALEILVIDADRTNVGLHRKLGLPMPPDFMDLFNTRTSFVGKEWRISALPSECLSEKNRIRLLSVGKIKAGDEKRDLRDDCVEVVRQLLDTIQTSRNEIVLVDTEAGFENFGSLLQSKVDAILMVVDPSCESLSLAEKVNCICQKADKPLYFIMNRTTAVNGYVMRRAVHKFGRIAGCLPDYKTISASGLKGREFYADYDEIIWLADFCQTL